MILRSIIIFMVSLISAYPVFCQKASNTGWWPDAKVGVMFHFGLYSVAGGELSGNAVDGRAERIMKNAGLSNDEYAAFGESFNPQSFSPREWVTLAKSAGARYFVFTAKGPDGFCMWDSKGTPFNVVRGAAYRRDMVATLATAAKEHGLKFGLYYSITDWYSENLPGFQASKFVDANVKPQLRELVQNYQPDLLLIDIAEAKSSFSSEDLLKYLKTLSSSLVVGFTSGSDGDYVSTEGSMDALKPFELRMSMSDSWGFKQNDTSWKSSKVIVTSLINTVTSGGNFLLNIGPKPFGTLATESHYRLSEVGKWTKLNGEAIYNTRPVANKDASAGMKFMASKDGKWWYVIVMDTGVKEIKLTDIKLRKGIKPVIVGTTKPVTINETKGGYTLKLPDGYKYEYAVSIKVPVVP